MVCSRVASDFPRKQRKRLIVPLQLWFCGRKSHRVETPHGTLFTDMVEPVFNALNVPGVTRTALVGVKRNGITYPVLCAEVPNRAARSSPQQLAEALSAGCYLSDTRWIRWFLFHPAFPVDVRHNSKIFREKLAVWADKQLGPNWMPPEEPT